MDTDLAILWEECGIFPRVRQWKITARLMSFPISPTDLHKGGFTSGNNDSTWPFYRTDIDGNCIQRTLITAAQAVPCNRDM
jgi:hypothetical protein